MKRHFPIQAIARRALFVAVAIGGLSPRFAQSAGPPAPAAPAESPAPVADQTAAATAKGSAGPAQVLRYETGRRLRQFESEWRETMDPLERRRALEPLQRSVSEFLSGRQIEAAQSLDAARCALRSAEQLPADVRWAGSLMLVPERRLADAGEKELPFVIDEFYKSGLPIPAHARATVSVVRPDVFAEVSLPITKLPQSGAIPLAKLGEGDFRLKVAIYAGDVQLIEVDYAFSLVDHARARLATLQSVTADFAEAKDNIDKQTSLALTTLLVGLAAGKVDETDYPAARLLAEAEAAASDAAHGQRFYGGPKAGQFWLRLPTSRAPIPVRLFVPPRGDDDQLLPLVVALHGAGGSENLFFDGYGQGEVVDECQRRGWMVVAPRSTGFGLVPVDELVDALSKRYPVDKRRVFIVGHSMGAMQATAAAQSKPDVFAAVAALGGGGTAKASEAIKRLPYFVAAGDRDFALAGAKRLAKNLEAVGAKVTFREYPDCEHLLIVQEALPEVFRFFDSAGAARE